MGKVPCVQSARCGNHFKTYFPFFYGSIFTYLDLDINSNAEHCPLQTDPDACYCH